MSSPSPSPSALPLLKARALLQRLRAEEKAQTQKAQSQPTNGTQTINYCSPRYGRPQAPRPAQSNTSASSSSGSASSNSSSESSPPSTCVAFLPARYLTLGNEAQRGPLPINLESDFIRPAQAQLERIAQQEREQQQPQLDDPSGLSSFSFTSIPRSLTSHLLSALPTFPAVLIPLILSYTQATSLPWFVSPRVGPQHPDSRPFAMLDHVSTPLLLAGYQLREIVGYGSSQGNGVQFVYGPPHVAGCAASSAASGAGSSAAAAAAPASSSTLFVTADHHGLHDHPDRRVFVLGPDEFVVRVTFRVGSYCDSLRFLTNLDREFRIGTSQGGSDVVFTAPHATALIALCGAVGGHLHNIGTVWASLEPNRRITQAEREGTEEEQEEEEEKK